MSAEELWASYSPKIKDYILKRIPDKHEAEDILQEVGIRMQKKRK